MYLKKIGMLGEKIASDYLVKKGYIVVEKNFSCKQGEIDIIAKDNDKKELVFLEVKTRTNCKYGTPIDAVNEQKQVHIYNSANYYVYKNKIDNTPIRFDVIEVNINDGKVDINHIKNVFLRPYKRA